MPIVEGRAFRDSDRDGAPWVAIISETFARQAWPGQSAIGRTLMQRISENEERAARDRRRGAGREVPLHQQRPARRSSTCRWRSSRSAIIEFYVRHAPGRQIAQEIRTAMAQVEPNVPIVMLQSFDDAAALGLLPQKLAAWIAGSVGTIGIFLAALGPLWPDGVPGRATHARDRDSHGARRVESATCDRWC